MSQSTDALTAAVQANTVAVNNAVAALGSNSSDEVIQAATTQIASNTAALVAAIPAPVVA